MARCSCGKYECGATSKPERGLGAIEEHTAECCLRYVTTATKLNSPELKFGDRCRALCSAPARYIEQGYCLYLSSQDHELNFDLTDMNPCNPPPSNLSYPSDRELYKKAG